MSFYFNVFKKYDDDTLIRDISLYKKGTGKLFKVLNHFFEEEQYKCYGGRGSSTPMQILYNEEEIAKIITFTKSKPNFYKGDDISNVKSYFRNAGRTAQKVANYPIKEATDLIMRYTNEGDTVYDPSCGFGSRLSATILHGRNYIGTDPNISLIKKLEECGQFYMNHIPNTGRYHLIADGSEMYHNIKSDFIFTSPPYFDLERYGDDVGQSVVKFKIYNEWLKGFVEPTVINCVQYIKDGGYVAINTKNLTSGAKYHLFDDWHRIMSEHLKYIATISMKQNSKRDYKGKHFTGVSSDYGESEGIMIFQKV